MRAIRSGYGIGDNLYLHPIARAFAEKEQIVVNTDYPDIFSGLNVKVRPFSRQANIHAVYTTRKASSDSQYVDMCKHAKLGKIPELKIDRPIRNQVTVDKLLSKADGRPICLLQAPRGAFGRNDGFGAELVPDYLVLAQAVKLLRERYYVVQVGAVNPTFSIPVDRDIVGQTTISDLLDVAQSAALFVGQCSNIIPLAEVFDKRVWVLFSERGFKSKNTFVSRVTPAKVFHKKHLCHHSVDSEPMDAIKAVLCNL